METLTSISAGNKNRFSSLLKVRFSALLFLIVLSFPPLAHSQRVDQSAIDFVVGSFEFALLHELAHLVISEKEVPILGPIESAADYIATTILISDEVREDASSEIFDGYVRDAALALATSFELSAKSGADIPYWGVHALGIQRYYSMMCLLYGSNPDIYTALPVEYALPEQRLAGCASELALANRGLNWLIETYQVDHTDPVPEVADFVYGRPESQQLAIFLNEIRELNIFELSVNAITQRFGINVPFTAAMRSCGSAEAAWQSETRELVVCHELLSAFYSVYREMQR